MRFTPHRGYRYYKLPVFITHASDRMVIVKTAWSDMTIRDLANYDHSQAVIYSCVSPDELLLYGNPELWTVRTWRGRISSLSYADRRIVPLSGNGWDESLPALFDTIDAFGVAAASVNTMSLNLWRSTLERPVYFDEASIPTTTDRLLRGLPSRLGPVAVSVGGRKEARPGRYRHRAEYDIRAAYPTAIADIVLPSRLFPIHTGEANRSTRVRTVDILSRWDGIGHARVRIPTHAWGPLPVLLGGVNGVTCYGHTQPTEWVSVTLPLSELRMAREYGCDVIVERASVGVSPQRVFDSWMADTVPALRALPALAGSVGKLITNRLWSCFAISTAEGARREHTFTSQGEMVTNILPADSARRQDSLSSTAYVGAMVASAVRQRLYREGLTRFGGVVYCDTDSVIASRSTFGLPDGWREKASIRSIEIAGPQAYRYYCTDCHHAPGGHSGPHYVVSGASDRESKSRLFEIIRQGGFVVSDIGNTIPSQDVNRATLPQAPHTYPAQLPAPRPRPRQQAFETG